MDNTIIMVPDLTTSECEKACVSWRVLKADDERSRKESMGSPWSKYLTVYPVKVSDGIRIPYTIIYKSVQGICGGATHYLHCSLIGLGLLERESGCFTRNPFQINSNFKLAIDTKG